MSSYHVYSSSILHVDSSQQSLQAVGLGQTLKFEHSDNLMAQDGIISGIKDYVHNLMRVKL